MLQGEGKLPSFVFAESPLAPGLDLYLDAFYALDSSRPIGMALGRIPWLAIREFGREMSMDAEELQRLHYLISRLDAHYLTRENEKVNAAAKAPRKVKKR